MNRSISSILESWMDESGLKTRNETIAFHVQDDKLFIVTRYPGWLIGLHGCLFDKYRRLLKYNGYDLKIRFVDVFCGEVREF